MAILEGKFEEPGYLVIDNDKITFHSAEGLWGLGSHDAEKQLAAKYGAEYSILSIGPAGENLNIMSCINCDYYRQAGRGGIGAGIVLNGEIYADLLCLAGEIGEYQYFKGKIRLPRGLYFYYWVYCMSKETKEFLGDDSINPGMEVVLCLITCGIYTIYWYYKYGKLQLDMGSRAGLPDAGNSILYLVLAILGLSIISMAIMQNQQNVIWDNSYYRPNP